MRRPDALIPVVWATALLAGACGNEQPLEAEATSQPVSHVMAATVTGFAYAEDVEVWGRRWVQHYAETSVPAAGYRQLEEYSVIENCTTARNSVPHRENEIDEPDDPACAEFDCESNRDTHCVPDEFAPRYNFLLLEDYRRLNCPGPRLIHERRPDDPARDEHCIVRRDGEWLAEEPRYHVRVLVRNDASGTNDLPEVFSDDLQVTPAQYFGLESHDSVVVTYANGAYVNIVPA